MVRPRRLIRGGGHRQLGHEKGRAVGMIGKVFKWVVGIAIVLYVIVTLSLKVLIADRKRPMDPVLMEKLESTQVELEECKATNEELRGQLAKQGETEATGPESSPPGESPPDIPANPR